ncbi:MAG: class I SAM-dependent methyltransferase [Bacteroidales bacterium]|nr:O-methyltransferase [Bacteroidales bacterium]MBR1950116.1 class I SAM-dependent methyltransferase [Bacteroidales bacterium]MBR2437960.1 class I SAM-dependent methyltransferase [Bacteroidales bacterium]MBR4087830.1 class I SAM-dependent methyltransferase [Bacteroidales bacterium]
MDLNTYLTNFSQEQDPVLQWLQKQTNLRTNHARMLCGPVEGKLMEMLSGMIQPKNILEIGAFTGYSAICLARGLKEGGMLDSLELNDELEDLILQAHERAGLSDKITLHIGDAKQTLKDLKEQGKMYDLVFIDANKREYPAYYDLVFDMVRPGGYILADNVLWDGKVYQDNVPQDAQTQGIFRFNEIVKEDPRVENVIIPLRDGMNLIRKK